MNIPSIIELIKSVTYFTISIAILLLVINVTMKKFKVSCKFFKIKVTSRKK